MLRCYNQNLSIHRPYVAYQNTIKLFKWWHWLKLFLTKGFKERCVFGFLEKKERFFLFETPIYEYFSNNNMRYTVCVLHSRTNIILVNHRIQVFWLSHIGASNVCEKDFFSAALIFLLILCWSKTLAWFTIFTYENKKCK